VSVDLVDQDAPNATLFMLSWAAPLGAVGQSRYESGPLPYRQFNRIGGTDVDDEGIDHVLMSVHTFGWARTPAERSTTLHECDRTHRRMTLLARDPLRDITMPDGSIANLDYLETVEKPRLSDYGVDTIHRYKAVYRFGLSFVAV
jgi:hypothetical protein